MAGVLHLRIEPTSIRQRQYLLQDQYTGLHYVVVLYMWLNILIIWHTIDHLEYTAHLDPDGGCAQNTEALSS